MIEIIHHTSERTDVKLVIGMAKRSPLELGALLLYVVELRTNEANHKFI